MKKTPLAFAFIVALLTSNGQQREAGSLVFENIPEIPADLPEQMNRYQNTRPANALGWSPAGKVLISTRFGESNQLHLVDHPLGARRQLTFFKEPINWGRYCPDPTYNGFLFQKDVGGNEFSQLYWYDLNTGNYQLLTDGKRSQNGAGLWSNKGDRFIYNSTKRNGKDYDLYLVSMTKPLESKMILEVSGSWQAVDWSPDDQRVLVRQYISANSSKLFIFELKSGKKEEINPSTSVISYGDAQFTAEGKGLFMVSDEGGEFHTLKYLDLATKKHTTLTGTIPWDLTELVLNHQRTRGVIKFNVNGIDELYELNCATQKYTALANLQKGLIGGLYYKKDGSQITFHLSNAKIPGDVFTYLFSDQAATRWTEGELGGLREEVLSGAELISYPTFDKAGDRQREIPAFIYRPNKKAEKNKKAPVLVIIHGGPEGQSRPGFSSFTSYLNNEMGIVVIQPNVRGSTGYGKTYLQMDNGFNREQSVQDIGAMLDWIAKQPDLDAQRIAVMGGSYGGYMSLASMTHFNDKLRCGVDVVGISNFVTFLKNTEEYRRDLRRVEYGDERDPKMAEFLEKISPMTNVGKITRPMLIVQGANDPRVPLSEAEQMKKKLMEKNVPTWYLMAKDEGHGFRKKTNVDHYQWTVVMFLRKHLLE